MNIYTPQPTELPAAPAHHRPSRSNSLSSSSVVTVKRSASLKDAVPDPSKPHRRATPPPSRRRSSAAAGAGETIGTFREGVGNLNRWSQSTAGSTKSPAREKKGHTQHPSVSRLPAALNSTAPLNGAAVHSSSPSRPVPSPTRTAAFSSRSPASSPQRRARPRSPAYHPPSSSATAPPQLPSLPFLPATVYDPSSSNASPSEPPSTAGLFTPSTYTTNSSSDYFSSKPRPPPSSGQRSPSRSKADRVLGRSPLGSPPIGVLESEARYRSNSGAPRSATGRRPSTAASVDLTRRPPQSAGHERSYSKEQDTRDRSESNASSRLDDGYQGTPPRTRERREKDKKTMLSRALQKANTAVLLDNAQNFEGAMEAYGDACKLLQQVMIRSSGEEDRRKLDSIRITYTNRIEELKRLDSGYHSTTGKSLPARPMSNESLDEGRSMLLDAAEEEAVIETATVTRIVNDRPIENQATRTDPEPPTSQQLPLRRPPSAGTRESVITTAIRDVQKNLSESSQFHLQPPPGRLANEVPSLGTPGLESPMDRSYMPPPLSPRRPISPLTSSRYEPESGSQNKLEQPARLGHQRGNSSESTSWLDTIDESGGSSCSSSVHSLSPGGVRRKHLRNASGATEAEFDAALDAAVEAAYDEGYEPYEDDEDMPNSAEKIVSRLKSVELAKERVRQAEREEAIAAAKYRYKETQLRNESLPRVRESAEFNFQDEAEEEERLLDEITREYMLDGFDFDLQTKSSLPRQSDSSGFSGSTYNSSVSSHRTTGGTSLSTVAEVIQQTKQTAPTHAPPPVPNPSSALPSVSESQTLQANDTSQTTPKAPNTTKEAASVRSRRLSGQNPKNLKIETSLPPVPPAPHTDKATLPKKEPQPDVPPLPKSAAAATFGSTQTSLDPAFKVPALPQAHSQSGLTAPSPLPLLPSPADTTFTVSPATPALSHAMSNDSTLAPGSPKMGKSSAMGVRKNKSSLSLKQRNLSVSSPDGSDGSVGTPLSASFSFAGRKTNATLPLPTPSAPTFNVDGLPSGGMHLFESDIHSPYSPGSPSAAVTNAPIPLEPCPDSYLLRPFWLMRCFYQTIAHPRGGYLSTKLFIPRDVWRVKGVKLKNVDDKIANCDMLTAALQKLSSVDTLDADAVLEEMQAFELILDQVQSQLVKKLGNEVGVHSVSSLFKDAYTVGTGSMTDGNSEKGSHGSQDHAPKGAVAQSKSYLTSWRKLRSKNSAVGLSSMAGTKSSMGEVSKDSLTMATLPMTSLTTIRFAKRDVSGVVFEGPNAAYMGSLAKLFDSVQILDQITRQVEDPGLKHSSPTHVGLELSARHAAEFFGFYICRFVLTDVTLMLDKFIKRGSEWVLV
ncbi:hypothetical protein K458DRAFT_385292 [Lentithecium fluviatile CBS 122367]|uniref:MIT domain-containing protein n=1 Tax=Lentithecium fluviatile CBS 122367 TaxID=1168545 RepID=A0A6G1JC52_9PLEO|nr:hypothetical protein K458DRAFT_385292 [Lentithecium fluviatile CBS 122367]